MNKKPIGVYIFSAVLIISSVKLLSFMPAYDFYKQVNHEWAEPFVKIRFFGSYVFKLIGLICGIGLLFKSDFIRKFLVGFSIYALATLPLRHTFNSMMFFTESIYRTHGSVFTLNTFTWIAVVICWLIDGVFSAAVIYYFTRPAIKAFFNNKSLENNKGEKV